MSTCWQNNTSRRKANHTVNNTSADKDSPAPMAKLFRESLSGVSEPKEGLSENGWLDVVPHPQSSRYREQ